MKEYLVQRLFLLERHTPSSTIALCPVKLAAQQPKKMAPQLRQLIWRQPPHQHPTAAQKLHYLTTDRVSITGAPAIAHSCRSPETGQDKSFGYLESARNAYL